MNQEVIFDDDGLCHAERDETWVPAIKREILLGIVEVEERSILANVICWTVIVLAAMTLPNATLFLAPLLFRLVAMVGTRSTFAKLRKCLARNSNTVPRLGAVMAALFVGGASWAATLLPVVIDPFLNPGRMLVGGAIITGVSIIVSLLSPVPRLAAAFIAGFMLIFGVGLLWAPPLFAIKAGLGLIGLFAIFVAYGYATIARHRKAAELLVENRLLSEELATSLAHAEFVAMHDPLTGLLNRRAFFQRSEECVLGSSAHVMTIDLDHFKSINDRFGHPIGDQVLVRVADALRKELRKLDGSDHLAARLGGEEFAVILMVSDSKLAQTIAEMVRHSVSLVGHRMEMAGLTTSASIGLSKWTSASSLDAALARADSALYRAKSRGRDCVIQDAEAA